MIWKGIKYELTIIFFNYFRYILNIKKTFNNIKSSSPPVTGEIKLPTVRAQEIGISGQYTCLKVPLSIELLLLLFNYFSTENM